MNDEFQNRKLNYQLQEMAFQKYPFQINNKTFFCLQTYFQDQLLNGVDLQLKQAKGISSQPQKISYLSQNQQLILAVGSNILSYNAQKRSYSLLTEVSGYVQILRTYTCKINNKTFIYWLQSDQQGLNIKNGAKDKNKDKQCSKFNLFNLLAKGISQSSNHQKKVTSILDLSKVQNKNKNDQIKESNNFISERQDFKGSIANLDASNKSVNNLNDKERSSQNSQDNNVVAQKINKKDEKVNLSSKKKVDRQFQQSPNKKLVKFQGNQHENNAQTSKSIISNKQIRSKKKVRIQTPKIENMNKNEHWQDDSQQTSKNTKKMRICLFDYQKKNLFHKQWIQIQQNETISQIVLFYTSQKMVGYIINDQTQQRAKIYYKKIKIDDSICSPKNSQRGFSTMKNPQKQKNIKNSISKFKYIESIFQIPLLKYNGQTDQYLFKDLNTIYSLQLYQVEHEMNIQKVSLKNILLCSGKSNNPKQPVLYSKNSIQFSQNEDDISIDEENLSKQIIKVTNKMVGKKRQIDPKQKYSIQISQQIQLFTDQVIVDLSLSQIYLVVLTNQFIRFYSIFNLNTLLFKSQIHQVQNVPPPNSIELNKSYLLLTHQNSTFVSSYTILQRKLKYNSTCQLDIEHCQGILKLFMNTYNCEVAILAKQFQIEGRMTNILKSRKIITNAYAGYKKTYIDLSLAYINFSSTKCQTKNLFLKQQRFRNILTCKWNSQYLIETQNQILAKQWRQSFQNLKCSCLHPTGQYLIIGFNDCFKIYSVTQQGLQNTYMSDGIKDCQSIAYSQYGEHFAVGSSNTICIYNSYNIKKKFTVVLPIGSLVESLEYRSNHLICVLKNKRIIIYHVLLEYKEIFTFNPKNYLNQNKQQFFGNISNLKKNMGASSVQNLLALTIKGLVSIQINSLYYDVELNVVIFSSGKKMFFLNTLTNQSLGNFDVQSISCMEYNKHLATLFLGTFTGQIIAFSWPNKPSNILSQLPRFKFHSQKVIKIKLTSDYKHLITLSSDLSIYKSNINYILNLKRLKGSEIAEYKGNKNAITYCNFLYNKGFCQFSHSQNTQKLQCKKQLQQQVVNTVFMLPQERLKQKEHLFQQIMQQKHSLNQQNIKQYQPLQQESSSLRNRIIKIKEVIIKTKRDNELMLQRQKSQFSQQSSKFLKQYSELNYDLRMQKLDMQQKIDQLKHKNKKQFQALIRTQQQGEKEFNQKISLVQNENTLKLKQYNQLPLIQQQKKTFLYNSLLQYNKQIELINTKNGQLSCKNSSIEKQILILKYRIQQLKFIIINANSSIDKLKNKQTNELEEKKVFQRLLVENAKIDVSEMQKKYIKATKQLIQKNKQIDIKLTQYQKQKQILIQLQKTVQKTQQQIDKIVDSLQQQKDFMKFLLRKISHNQQKIKQLNKQKTKKKFYKSKLKSDIKTFCQQVQNLQKQYEIQSTQIKNQTESTDQLLNKLHSLVEWFDDGKPNNQNNKIFTKQTVDNKNLSNKNDIKNRLSQDNNKKLKSKIKKDKEQKRKTYSNQRKQSQTITAQLIPNLKKTSNFYKDKKSTIVNVRCVTEVKQQNQNQLSNQVNERISVNKKNFKINHSKFRQQFNLYRKDDILINKTMMNFNSSKQNQNPSHFQNNLNQQPILKKRFNKKMYQKYHVKTQSNQLASNTQRKTSNDIFKNQRNEKLKIQQNSTNQQQSSLTFRNSCNYDSQKMVQFKKQAIYKQLTKQNKHLSKIKTDKKLFMTSKKKLHLQNQDLLTTYNSLTYDNKYYKNILKAYEENLDEEDKNYIFNNPVNARQMSKNFLLFAAQSTKNQGFMKWIQAGKINSSNRKSKDTVDEQNKIHTPFENYIKNKQKKTIQLKNRSLNMKDSSINLTQIKQDNRKNGYSTARQGFKISLNAKSRVNQTNRIASESKRIRTVPCVQLNF